MKLFNRRSRVDRWLKKKAADSKKFANYYHLRQTTDIIIVTLNANASRKWYLLLIIVIENIPQILPISISNPKHSPIRYR